MKPKWFLAASVAVAIFVSASHAAERDVRRVFAVRPGCSLEIDTYRGEITIAESDEPVIKVLVHMEIGGDTEAAAERILGGLQLEMKEANNTVSIFARHPRETRARWIWREDEQIGLFYRITVPRRCNLAVKTPQGSLTVGRLEGNMRAELKAGTIFFRGVDGSVEAKTGEGDVVVSRCTGALTATVGQGLIRAGTIGGKAELKNASGSIEVMMARGGVLAHATAGDVTVGFPRPIGGPAKLTSSGGNVVARVDPAANCAIEASSRWGEVRCGLPVAVDSGARSKRKLHARLNGGGPVLALHAHGGDVRIEPGETLFE